MGLRLRFGFGFGFGFGLGLGVGLGLGFELGQAGLAQAPQPLGSELVVGRLGLGGRG